MGIKAFVRARPVAGDALLEQLECLGRVLRNEDA